MAGELPFFSSDAFLEAFAEWYAPGARPAYVSCEGATTRLLVRRGRAVAGLWNVRTFHEPLAPPPGEPVVAVPTIPDMVAQITGVDESPNHRLKAAPFIRWSAFETWDDYKAAALARKQGASFRALAAKERALTRTLGPVRYTAIDLDDQLFDQIFAWKSAQLTERREQNRFSVPRNAAFFKELQRRGLLFGASLRVADTLVAGLIWGLTAGRRTAYLPGFHAGYAEHSPGSLLQLHILRDSFDSGDKELDFLTGEQPYKLAHSTHIRWLATLGREPFIDRARRSPRMVAGKALLKAPGLQRRARQAEAALGTLSARVRKR